MTRDKDIENDKESFRDHLTTVSKEGKRNWIFPQKPSGRYYAARNIVAVILLLFFFSAPFIKINGQPLLLLNILERKFVIFGMAFWPQDLHLLVFGALSIVIFIVLFTAVFGRLWCGWACPQTIFMEMVFRRIEYWIEGDRGQQIRLNKAPWNWTKIWKKTLKQGIFFGLAFIISNLFLAYIIGVDELYTIVTDPPSEHLGGLSAMIIFSGVFYGVFAFLREQVCHFICPYGRMQSVLLDNNSINVMYDYVRGEPRGKVAERNDVGGKATLEDLGLSPESDYGYGDCIDCKQCVRVCPMGIDIRNGTQLECVHCTACIDACDDVMDKIDKPRGLIRYSSEDAIKEGKKKILTPRVAGYSGILVVLLAIFVTLLSMRPDTETSILRQPGTLYQTLPNNQYSNIYEIKAINKTFDAIDYEVRLRQPEGELVELGDINTVPAQGSAQGRLLVKLSGNQLTESNTELVFDIYANGNKIETVTSGFIGPGSQEN
ncbi:cytochrome c oxidase accessory protein CcoG [Aliifodinibius sp. S!AR15-10]|uniref:cytochrome c oxidase accessory protein CcoG n=1 Tax=Aliifodinibius sp. S!AR15-10 TaxID=2950437 RepID=UPI0028559EC4|nr:cytochrome c oxidase accessory protein CcoG [Aliifodinibius sp. S!AR15-10]MDR8393425.1 cytochrome c oxidase accessory protein CcoG [Aliifodinibius sp. S!AR15-10]